MERKIGEVFEFEGKMVKAVKGIACDNCVFTNVKCSDYSCIAQTRLDGTDVYFIEVDNATP